MAPEGQERGDSYNGFLTRYHQAVHEHHEVTADNPAHALLGLALQHQEHPDFKTAWREWQRVGPALEDGAT